MSVKHWRLELFFKTQADLATKRIPYIKEHGVHRLNLTNKTKDDHLLDSVSKLLEESPQADICVHYSIKWNYKGDYSRALTALSSFLADLGKLGSKSKDSTLSVLLISGGGKKKKLDTVKALQDLKQEQVKVPLHVAFNPYFPEEKDIQEERRRMKDKLKTGLVSGVWLQTGSDLQKLEDGLKFLRQETSKDMNLYGSIFLPDKRLLAQMKYRPWNGVFLDDEYLSSPEKATEITKKLLACYAKYDVVPLLETALNNKADMQNALKLMGLA